MGRLGTGALATSMRRLALDSTGSEATLGEEDEDWKHEELRAPFLIGAVKVMGGAQLFKLQSVAGLFIDRAATVSGHGAGRVGTSSRRVTASD